MQHPISRATRAVANILPMTTLAMESVYLWWKANQTAASFTGSTSVEGATNARSAAQGGNRRSQVSIRATGGHFARAAMACPR